MIIYGPNFDVSENVLNKVSSSFKDLSILKPDLHIVVRVAEHACDDASKRILKPSTYRLQIFLVRYQYLRSLLPRGDQDIAEQLEKHVLKPMLAILTTYMETSLNVCVHDQVRTLSQVGTSSHMAYAMQELTQGVPVWLEKFLLSPIVKLNSLCSFHISCLLTHPEHVIRVRIRFRFQ